MTAALLPLLDLRTQEEIDLAELQDSQTGILARAIMAAGAEARRVLPVREIRRAVEEGDTESLEGPMLAGALAVAAWSAAALRSAALLANSLSPREPFDETSPAVTTALRESRARIRRELGGAVGDYVSEVLAIGRARGWTEGKIARELRAGIGLNAAGARAVENFRRMVEEGDAEALRRALRDRRFDPSIRRSIDGEPLTAAHIDRIVDRYRARTIAARAELIARLETQRAIGAGLNAYFEQAFAAGALGDVEQVWFNRPPNVRDSHAFMNRQRRPFGEPFLSGDGNSLRYPGDPAAPISDTAHCKCGIRVFRRR